MFSFTNISAWFVIAITLIGCNDPCKTALKSGTAQKDVTLDSNATCPPPTVSYDVTPHEFSGKIYVGYQAWFNTPADGTSRGWVHWGRTTPLSADQMLIDLWPHTAEYGSGLTDSGFILGNGQKAKLFSSYDMGVINTHMRWMQEYGIDGLFLQWFVVDDANYRLAIAKRVRQAAETYDREFSIMIDFSGSGAMANSVDNIKNRWMMAVDAGLTSSPKYMKVNGLPLVSVWGFGYSHNNFLTPQDALNLIEWFHISAPEKYRAAIMGGVTQYWRTTSDWQEAFAKFDIISPWAVGSHSDDNSAARFVETFVKPDIQLVGQRGQKYLPVIFPGFSWHNLSQGPLNQIPRRGGQYIWTQAREMSKVGIKSLYTAMFDEVDEGTAIFKTAGTSAEAPVEFPNVTLDADGRQLPNDWYLQVTGEISRALKTPNLSGFNSQQLPISP